MTSFFGCNPDRIEILFDGKMIIVSGYNIYIFDAEKRTRRQINDGKNEIESVAAYQNGKKFAVAESFPKHCIHIYSYPDLQIKNTLEEGNENKISAICFDKVGKRLASTSGQGDQELTIWDLDLSQPIVKCLTGVYNVTKLLFSQFHPGKITLISDKRIQFWKLQIKGGYKLTRQEGDFCTMRPLNVNSIETLPSGITLTGSDHGYLLRWEGNRMVARYGREGQRGCHDGDLAAVQLGNQGMMLLTGGADGFVRWWLLSQFESQIQLKEDKVIQLTPLKEINIGQRFNICSIIPGNEHWLLGCSNGRIISLRFSDDYIEQISIQSTKRINSISLMGGTKGENSLHRGRGIGIALACEDGKLIIIDGRSKRMAAFGEFTTPVSQTIWLPECADPDGRRIMIGFSDEKLTEYLTGQGLKYCFICKLKDTEIYSQQSNIQDNFISDIFSI
ncbi:MAG: putative WD repeat protein [Streblomastix strix]|uniref:Putative WD repeat protein n=1 Tax=Streblomastix strix TaxID=222440 RepID=A0A5J4UII3_9EUKA|nr:MAG: putative WD repeat protein [Streblomastix strix]